MFLVFLFLHYYTLVWYTKLVWYALPHFSKPQFGPHICVISFLAQHQNIFKVVYARKCMQNTQDYYNLQSFPIIATGPLRVRLHFKGYVKSVKYLMIKLSDTRYH